MYRSLLTIAPAVLSFLSTPLHAFHEGTYVGGFGGSAFACDSDWYVTDAFKGEMEHSTGWVAGGTFGHSWMNGFACEVEASYRENPIDEMTWDGNDLAAFPTGMHRVLAFMANGYYRFQEEWDYHPYLGGGIGAAYVESRLNGSFLTDVESPQQPVSVPVSLGCGDWVFAYQAMAGVESPMNETVTWFVEYRYFGTCTAKQTFASSTIVMETDYHAHMINGGVRLNF